MRNCTEEHKTDKGNLVSGHMVANLISMHDWVGGSLNQSVTDHAQTENCAKRCSEPRGGWRSHGCGQAGRKGDPAGSMKQ